MVNNAHSPVHLISQLALTASPQGEAFALTSLFRHPRGCPCRAPLFIWVLAAAAVVVTAAVIAAAVAAVAAAAHTAAVAEQEDQDDDPANVTAAETVVITHKTYLREILERIHRSFQDIPWKHFGAKKGVLQNSKIFQ